MNISHSCVHRDGWRCLSTVTTPVFSCRPKTPGLPAFSHQQMRKMTSQKWGMIGNLILIRVPAYNGGIILNKWVKWIVFCSVSSVFWRCWVIPNSQTWRHGCVCPPICSCPELWTPTSLPLPHCPPPIYPFTPPTCQQCRPPLQHPACASPPAVSLETPRSSSGKVKLADVTSCC